MTEFRAHSRTYYIYIYIRFPEVNDYLGSAEEISNLLWVDQESVTNEPDHQEFH